MVDYLRSMIEVVEADRYCILSLPINTVDNRWVDVTVEDKGSDFFLVHDSGKSSDELFLQGVTITEAKNSVMQSIANKFGINLDHGRFIVGCKRDHLQHSIWAVAQCSGLAMTELLRHRPTVEEETLKTSVGRIVSTWSKAHGLQVVADVEKQGKIAKHTFDFITELRDVTLAVNILNPASGALARAERYGYQALDLKDTEVDTWKKLAVIASPGVWSAESRRIVRRLADETVDYSTPGQSTDSVLDALERLAAA